MKRNILSNGIIFGSTGTLGSRISLDLAQMNTNLILHGKSLDKLIKLDNEIKKVNKNVTLLQADITHKDFATNLLSKVASRFSRIDFMINLVGVFFGLRPLTNFSHKEWDNLIEINLSSCWRIIKELEPLIRKSANAKIVFLENKDISVGKAYHNTFSICQKAKKTMLEIFNKEKNFKGGNHLYYKGFKQENQPFLNSESGNVWGYKGSTGDIDWSYDYHRMINSFRKFPEVAGWLYTEHHDVINEWNGYWKFDRSEKYTGLSEIFGGMTINDFHSPIYLSTGVEICRSVKNNEKVKIPLFISSMTNKKYGKELLLDYKLIHMNYIAEESLVHSSQIKIEYKPWIQKSLMPIDLTMANVSGLSKLILTLKTLDGKILHRNFMHFEVKSEKKIKGIKVIDLPVISFSNSSWTKKMWQIFDGKKINGTGSGFFEYEFEIPDEIKKQKFKKVFFIVEASAKELFEKDREDNYYIDAGIDFMKGSKLSPSINPNSYPMTDTKFYQSKIDISVNGEVKKRITLKDDPADHRGILSWHNQKNLLRDHRP